MSVTRESVVSVPDIASAQLLREVLVEGGLEDVEVHTVTGNAYLGRASSLGYEVRVPLEDVERAKLLLRDYSEEASPAAMRQAGAMVDDVMPPRRRPWVKWVAFAAVAPLILYALLAVFMIVQHFVSNLAGN